MLRQAAAMVRLLAPVADDAWWYCWIVLMASMGWSEHLTQAAAKALARPFLRPSDQAEADAGAADVGIPVVAVAVAVADVNAPPLGIALALVLALALAYLKVFCASSSGRMLLFLRFLFLMWVLLFRGRDAAARTELRAADTCSTKANTSTTCSISSTGSIVRVEPSRRRFRVVMMIYDC
jgi:hypothetical protein